jgi:hypothetical protein
MTAPQEFPATLGVYDLPMWAEDGTVTDPGDAYEETGFSAGESLPAAVLNFPHREAARWARALAARALDGSANLMGTWAPDAAAWTPIAAGLNATLAASTLWLDPDDTGAVKVQARVVAGNPHTFTASKDTYVAVSIANMLALHDDPTSMEFDEVANGAGAPTPSAGFIYVWKVVTDGSTITSSTLQIPEVPTFRTLSAAGLTLDTLSVGVLTVQDNSSLGNASAASLLVSGATTLSSGLDMDSSSISNVDALAAASLSTTGNVSIGGNLDMTAGSISNVTTLATTGNVSVGGNLDMTSGSISNVTTIDTSSNATVGGTLGVTGALTATGGISLPSGADLTGSAGTVITAPTIDTSDSAGVVKVGELQFYSDASPSSTTGVLQFFGRGLSVGISTTAKRISIPFEDYIASPADSASSTATGASVTVTLVAGDVVYVTASADVTNNGVSAQVVVFEIAIDGVNTGSPGNLRHPAAGVYIPCTRTIKYTAPGTANYTFVQRYGASSGTASIRNSYICVRQGN